MASEPGRPARVLARRRPLVSRRASLDGETIELVIYGVPAPKGNKRLSPSGAMYESAKGLKAWERAIGDALDELELRFGRQMLPDVPLAGVAYFYLPKPRSVRRERPDVKPDLSKLVRALEDPLNGRAIVDDARIVRWTVEKRYAEAPEDARVELRIRPYRPRAGSQIGPLSSGF